MDEINEKKKIRKRKKKKVWLKRRGMFDVTLNVDTLERMSISGNKVIKEKWLKQNNFFFFSPTPRLFQPLCHR